MTIAACPDIRSCLASGRLASAPTHGASLHTLHKRLVETGQALGVTAAGISYGTSIPWVRVPSVTSCLPSLRLSIPTRV